MTYSYKIISIILCLALVATSLCGDALALRPMAYSTQRKTPENSRHAAANTKSSSSGKLIFDIDMVEDADIHIPDTLRWEEIEHFFESHNIKVFNIDKVSALELSLIIHFMKMMPKKYFSGLKIAFIDLISNLSGVHVPIINLLCLPSSGCSVNLYLYIFLHELGHSVESRFFTMRERLSFFSTCWNIIPIPYLPVAITVLVCNIALYSFCHILEYMGLPFLIAGPLTIGLFTYFIFSGYFHLLSYKLSKKFGLGLGVRYLGLRKKEISKFISEYSMSTPDDYFADAFAAYFLFNKEFRKGAAENEQIKHAYEVLKTKISSDLGSSFSRPPEDDRKLEPDVLAQPITSNPDFIAEELLKDTSTTKVSSAKKITTITQNNSSKAEIVSQKDISNLKKVLIFDLGGTLYDCPEYDKVYWHCFFNLLKSKGVSKQQLNRKKEELGNWRLAADFFNVSSQEVQKYMLKHIDINEFEFHVNPKLIKMLKNFKSRGYRLVVLTNKNRMHTDQILDKLNLKEGIFEKVFTSSELSFPKPNPKAFSEVLTKMNIDGPSRVISIGNNYSNDIESPKKALGIPGVLVKGPDDIVDNLHSRLRELGKTKKGIRKIMVTSTQTETLAATKQLKKAVKINSEILSAA